ncbi:helix-turn-helix domain-containing protein [Paenalkalicoccus suaedae]|uniref:Helix-turn-helix domain-containing protein n=1 Tax=Paenalkalicoccus suaedae TaxID=2592382 RepID=A0A859FEM8_9BACI|nr:helix-turn-helix domain-containing protein [Paenalkalicoccus suaedae]QKS70686.1 helix-turn-helix domain-containing protein [Paenalkalicoccus suaedae]
MRSWLINLRKNMKLTQSDVAEKVFLDRGYYAQIEHGVRDPSIETAIKIAEVFQVEPTLFFNEKLYNPFYHVTSKLPIIFAICDLDLRYTWISNPSKDFSFHNVIGKTDFEITHNSGVEALVALKKRTLQTEQISSELITFPLSKGDTTYLIYAKPIYDGDILSGVATTSVEFHE